MNYYTKEIERLNNEEAFYKQKLTNINEQKDKLKTNKYLKQELLVNNYIELIKNATLRDDTEDIKHQESLKQLIDEPVIIKSSNKVGLTSHLPSVSIKIKAPPKKTTPLRKTDEDYFKEYYRCPYGCRVKRNHKRGARRHIKELCEKNPSTERCSTANKNNRTYTDEEIEEHLEKERIRLGFSSPNE